MNNLDTDWQKTLNIFKNQIDDKIIFDSFFTTLQVKDIIDSDVTITVDTQWSLDGVSPYLEKLEEIANSYEGVDKSFAIQAGREIRIMVKPENVSDEDIHLLARDMTKRIEDELEYPGQIKVSIIRETRAIEYAK